MKKSTLVISSLVVTLIVTNIWWAIETIDSGISRTYQNESQEVSQQALSQALAIIKASGSPDVTRMQIIEAAEKAWPSSKPFEKDGYLWVGRLGLRFDKNDRLIDAVAG